MLCCVLLSRCRVLCVGVLCVGVLCVGVLCVGVLCVVVSLPCVVCCVCCRCRVLYVRHSLE